MEVTQRLIFVGGAPGVGKTTTCEHLYASLPDSICLDGDDLWCKMNPFRVDHATVTMIERNLAAVLRNSLEAGFRHVILCWVLHQKEIVHRLLEPLRDLPFSFSWVTLVCEEVALQHRWAATHSVSSSSFQQACHRLRQTRQLRNSHMIDNTATPVEEVVQTIIRIVEEPQPTGGVDAEDRAPHP
jgi:broad-specificity NMP kinase